MALLDPCELSADEEDPIKCIELLHGCLYRCGHKLFRSGAILQQVLVFSYAKSAFISKISELYNFAHSRITLRNPCLVLTYKYGH